MQHLDRCPKGKVDPLTSAPRGPNTNALAVGAMHIVPTPPAAPSLPSDHACRISFILAATPPISAAPDDGAVPESQTKPKFAISGMSPADGTTAARVAPLGIRHFPLAAKKTDYII
jgi:hypothetical protein